MVAASGSPAPYAPRVVALNGASVTASAGIALLTQPLPEPDTPVDTLIVPGRTGRRSRRQRPSAARLGGATRDGGSPGRVRLHGRLSAGPRRCAGRSPYRHALVVLRGTGPPLPRDPRRAGPDLHQGRFHLDFGRCDIGNRPRLGPGRGGSRPRHRSRRGALPCRVPQTIRRPGSVQHRPAAANRGGPLRQLAPRGLPTTSPTIYRSPNSPKRPE